jgi:transposase-like protein
MMPTEQCSQCGQTNMATETNCLACRAPLALWQSLPQEVQQRYTCWRCGGRYTLITQTPHKGSGCVVVALGLIFAPVLIGIILIIYGIQMMGETQSYWQCRSCGLTLPA